MKRVVFYSWQSALPNGTNQGFIGDVLARVVKAIHQDESIEVEPVIDRDTSGVPGSPDIAGTIFQKIAACDVFVADVSLITPAGASRPCPNPNVLLELGFAIKALGWERIVMVMNTAFGDSSLLPFDLRGRLIVPYALANSDEADKAAPRKFLEGRLTEAIRAVFEHQLTQTATAVVEPQPLDELVMRAVDSQAPNRETMTRRFMRDLYVQLDAIAPDLAGGTADFQVLASALDATKPIVATFGRIAGRAAEHGDQQTLGELFKGLSALADRYVFSGSGTWYEHQFDFWRFLGYELAVMLVASMIREDRWEATGQVLKTDLVLENTNKGRRQLVTFAYLYKPLPLLEGEGKKRGRVSLRADLIKDRHSFDPLREVIDFQTFVDADYFMFLRTELSSDRPRILPDWIPESAVFLKQPPRYLHEAQRIQLARRIAAAIGVDSPETMRNRLLERHSLLGTVFKGAVSPLFPFEDGMDVIRKLGSRG